ncbi:MAG: phage portal protein [bacterium]|nr:phage portal protein [bacterium]
MGKQCWNLFQKQDNQQKHNFAGNASGVAIRYKLMNFENRVSRTERYFTRGLQRRFELICNILNLLSGPYDYTTIVPQFTRNIQANLSEIATEVTQLNGIVSQKTLLAQIPFITDPEQELKQLTEEQAQYNMTSFGRADREEETEASDYDEDAVNDKQ